MIRKPQIGSERRDGPGFRKWGFPWLPEDELGARHRIDIHTDPLTQLARIGQESPAHINTLPSNILRLGVAAARLGLPPIDRVCITHAKNSSMPSESLREFWRSGPATMPGNAHNPVMVQYNRRASRFERL